ncbi:hypothetical protein COOONC_13744 [Cooperia oncophora]
MSSLWFSYCQYSWIRKLQLLNLEENCGKEDEVYLVQVPRVFRYLTAELAAMNIKIHLGITDFAKVARA